MWSFVLFIAFISYYIVIRPGIFKLMKARRVNKKFEDKLMEDVRKLGGL